MSDVEDKKLHQSFVYKDVDAIRFGMWLERYGWEFYDSDETMINQAHNNSLESLKELFKEFKKENPEP